MSPTTSDHTWRGEWLGAVNATAAMLPFVLTYGYIAFGGLGAQAGQVGLAASVIAVVLGGAVMLLFTRARVPGASPSASSTLILGGAVLALLRDPALGPASPGALNLLLGAVGLMVAASGTLLMLLGALRVGRLARFVPQPVLAGFMNGVAILIVASQGPPLLGLPAGAWQIDGWRALSGWHWQALVVALGTAALVALIGWRWPRAPAPLIALSLAAAAVWAWQGYAPAAGPATLPRIGPLQAAYPTLGALSTLLDASSHAVLQRQAATLIVTILLLALIGALESVLNLAAVDQHLNETTDPDRELIALGAANVLCGALGGLPLVAMRLRAMATLAGGGRSWRSALLGSALLGLVFTFGLPLVQHLPTAVVAGIVVMLAWTLADQWSRRLARQWWSGHRSADLHRSLAVVALVCAVTVARGFAAGVAVGVVVAVVQFIRAMHRSLVRHRHTAADTPSRRVRPAAQEAWLALARPRIEVIELEGALFFGNSERLLREGSQVHPALTDLIIDLRRVSTLDASGALAIAQLAQRLGRRGAQLRLAGVSAGHRHGIALVAHGVTTTFDATGRAPQGGEAIPAHPDADRALEAAEDEALRRLGGPAAGPIDLSACPVCQGLSLPQVELLRSAMFVRRLAAGERLFAQGEPARSMYLLTAGSISVVHPQDNHRFASFSAGMCFGETALLDGRGRSADAWADTNSEVHELSAEAYDALQLAQPVLAARLNRNLARHLSERLRAAGESWRRVAG